MIISPISVPPPEVAILAPPRYPYRWHPKKRLVCELKHQQLQQAFGSAPLGPLLGFGDSTLRTAHFFGLKGCFCVKMFPLPKVSTASKSPIDVAKIHLVFYTERHTVKLGENIRTQVKRGKHQNTSKAQHRTDARCVCEGRPSSPCGQWGIEVHGCLDPRDFWLVVSAPMKNIKQPNNHSI